MSYETKSELVGMCYNANTGEVKAGVRNTG